MQTCYTVLSISNGNDIIIIIIVIINSVLAPTF
jgi:hypothetical protein